MFSIQEQFNKLQYLASLQDKKEQLIDTICQEKYEGIFNPQQTKIKCDQILNQYFSLDQELLRNIEISQFIVDLQILHRISAKFYNNIVCLSITNCLIGRQAFNTIMQFQFKYLKFLNLVNNKIDSQCMQVLSTKNWKELQQINFRQNKITNKGVVYLLKTILPKIKKLQLQDNPITIDIYRTINKYESYKKCIVINLPNLSIVSRRQQIERRFKCFGANNQY